MLSVIIAAAFYKQHSATRGTVQYVGHHAPYTRKHNDLCVPSDHLQADSKLRRGVPVSVVACMSHWRLTAASQILLQDPNGVLIAKVIGVLIHWCSASLFAGIPPQRGDGAIYASYPRVDGRRVRPRHHATRRCRWASGS